MAILSLVVLAFAAAAWGEELVCDKDNEGSCAPSMLEVKQASVKKHATVGGMDDDGGRSGVDLATTIANWRAAFATTTSFCLEGTSTADDCVNKPTTTEECSARSGTTVCKCAGGDTKTGCNVDFADGVTGRCANIVVFFGGAQAETHGSDAGVSGTSKEMFCKKMVLNDQWRQKGFLASTPERVDKEKVPWVWPAVYRCPSGYTAPWSLSSLWSDGQCHRKRRYLTERCWQAWGDEGTCAGSDTKHSEYSTSCFQDTCVPYAEVMGRYPCECSWAGFNFYFVCSAKNDACNGHACVLHQSGERFCDFSSKQDWQTLLSR